ncbi:MAG: propionyl-CoA synthetase [Leptospiraceae bacterium]|nr:propionyl-CoA synthetase [Leptospiraceae bacterium]MCP5511020.1 propionyl-CoA synthetase [Leptospiraceae bacterium]
MSTYEEQYKLSISDPDSFWREKSKLIEWFEQPKSILSKDEEGLNRWFQGGKLNTSYLALDFHIHAGRGNQLALIYDSPVTDNRKSYTYSELKEEVELFAGVLKSRGIQKGDTVIIYMPMIPEAVMAMLACARLGAIHSVVFGGFAPHELAIRIDDAKPKLIVTASYGIEIEKLIHYKPLLDEAIHQSTHKPSEVLVVRRPNVSEYMHTGRDFYLDEVNEGIEPATYVPVDSWDPLYILYTSGTTGKPKGVVRDNGGHAVALKYSMNAVYGAHAGDIFWAASDVGWVVGHSYIVYGPLLHGCTTILYEGKPVRTPDAGAFFRMISDYNINFLFTAPTALRAIKKEDPNGNEIKKYDISSLKTLFLAGERTDPATYYWAEEKLGVPVVDHWWQTETGWAITANPMGLHDRKPKAGSTNFPVPGFDLKILDEEGREVPRGSEGFITLKLPLPPGCLPTLWKDTPNFQKSYLETYPGYYLTGDGGYIDQDGYLFVMGRIDDVINVAGHRLSTGEMEEIISHHEHVAETAVIGIADEIKGQVPVGFVVIKDGDPIDPHKLESEIAHVIREEIGAIASFKSTMVVKRLPKTRSGKILRKTLRKIADGEPYHIPSTIDDPTILEEIIEVMKSHRVGKAFQGS